MAKRSKRIACFSLCSLILCINFNTVKAEALPDVMSGSSTIADCVMSYYSMVGCAIADQSWIQTLYNGLGSSFGTIEELAQQGYLVLDDAGNWQPVQALTDAIEEVPAYASLKLNEMFNVSAEEAAQAGGAAATTGGGILASACGGVASTGLLPLFAGVTGAYWGGIAIGTLAAHALGLYGDYVGSGLPISFPDSLFSVIPKGNENAIWIRTNGGMTIYSGNGAASFAYLKSNQVYIGLYNTTTNTINIVNRIFSSNGNETISDSTLAGKAKTYSSLGSSYIRSYFAANKFDTESDFNAAMSSWVNGYSTPKTKPDSPDIIGPEGNQSGTYNSNTQTYNIPEVKPQIDPGTQAGKPLTMQDWLDFANSVRTNNNQTNPIPGNKDLYERIMDDIVGTPENTNPDPDPWSPPVVTPVPDPEYPDPVPDQEITENPQESENPQQTENPIDTGKPWKLPDLRNKFPFCIPWDIAKIFSKLKVNARQAPHISWRFNPPNTPIDYTFNLDLEDFESAAALLRTLELMGFIVGLAIATRYLIGAN